MYLTKLHAYVHSLTNRLLSTQTEVTKAAFSWCNVYLIQRIWSFLFAADTGQQCSETERVAIAWAYYTHT